MLFWLLDSLGLNRTHVNYLADWTNEVSLKADKDQTPEQREHFKQQVIKALEADPLMMAQGVSLFIVGVPAQYLKYLTLWAAHDTWSGCPLRWLWND